MKHPYFLHKLLFNKGILIVEKCQFNLDKLPKDKEFKIFAIPLKMKVIQALLDYLQK